MQHDQNVELVFRDDGERARVLRLIEQSPERRAEFERGIAIAGEMTVPLISAGKWGITAAAIDRAINEVAGYYREDRLKDGDSEEEIFLYLAGLMGVARRRRDTFLGELAVLAKLTEANNLVAAGLNAATDAMNLAMGLQPPAPARPPQHALALGRVPARPLRPEDFGALPTGLR